LRYTRLIADVVTGKLDVRDTAASLQDEPGEPEAFDGAGALAEDEEERARDLDAEPVQDE
jgi:type I restriction enzyme S subunit